MAIRNETPDSAAAATPGRRFGDSFMLVLMLDRTPPTGGPRTRPRPNAIPMRAMPFDRFFSSVESATYACAVEMLAAATPQTIREAKNMATLDAKANVQNPRTFPRRLAMITGLRPIRSESRPQSGEKRNCISEKLPRIMPSVVPPAP